jgi:hypothetical protein
MEKYWSVAALTRQYASVYQAAIEK